MYDCLQEFERYAMAIEFYFSDMSTTIREMHTVLENDIVGVLHEAIEEYLALNITKSELSSTVQSYVVNNALTSVVSNGHDVVSHCQEMAQQTHLQLAALQAAYTELFTFTLPVISHEDLVNLTYLGYLQHYGSNGTNAIMASLYDDPLGTTLAVLEDMYEDVFIHELNEVKDELDGRLNALAEAAGDLEDSLESYSTETRMNYQFYT